MILQTALCRSWLHYSIGDWYYGRGQKYMTVGEMIRMLTDIGSKNGNLLLNVVKTLARRTTISRKIRYIGQRYRVQPA